MSKNAVNVQRKTLKGLEKAYTSTAQGQLKKINKTYYNIKK